MDTHFKELQHWDISCLLTQNAIRKALHNLRETLGDTQDRMLDGGFAPVGFSVGMCVCVLSSREARIKAGEEHKLMSMRSEGCIS